MGLNAIRIQAAQDYKNGAALVAALLALAQAGRLFEVDVYNTSANTYYIQIHDSAAAPVDFTTIRTQIKIGSDQFATGSWEGQPFKNGIYVLISTSNVAVTPSVAADCLIDVAFTARL